MTTNKTRTTRNEIDPCELLETLQFTRIERRTHAGGTWVCGRIAGHRFDALIFPAHAERPEFELDDSRISKLWLQRLRDRATVANFDRGWDVRPTTDEARTLVDLLVAGLADAIR